MLAPLYNAPTSLGWAGAGGGGERGAIGARGKEIMQKQQAKKLVGF
jgi:hypothetical protein